MSGSGPLRLSNDPRTSAVSEIAELGPNQPSEESVLSSLAQQLQTLGGAHSTEDVLRLGELIHRTLVGTTPLGSGAPSLRRIAAYPGIPFKLTTLWRAVSVYEMSLRMPQLVSAPTLGVSHLRAVIGLEPSEQQRLLAVAAEQRWTKRQLEKEVARLRHGAQRRGRRPLSPAVAWARDLTRLLQRGAEALDETREMIGETREQLRQELAQLNETAARVRALLGPETERESVFPPSHSERPAPPESGVEDVDD